MSTSVNHIYPKEDENVVPKINFLNGKNDAHHSHEVNRSNLIEKLQSMPFKELMSEAVKVQHDINFFNRSIHRSSDLSYAFCAEAAHAEDTILLKILQDRITTLVNERLLTKPTHHVDV